MIVVSHVSFGTVSYLTVKYEVSHRTSDSFLLDLVKKRKYYYLALLAPVQEPTISICTPNSFDTGRLLINFHILSLFDSQI